VTSLKGAASK